MKMPKFRKKPVIVEAEQFWPDKPLPFCDRGPYVAYDGDFYVTTIHGDYINLTPGDWVIRESRGVFFAYPCKPDIFDATYEPVRETVVNWVRLGDLPPGLIFATQNGVLAVKSEYHNSWTGQCMCVLLQSGEYAHFLEGDETLVTALEIAEMARHD